MTQWQLNSRFRVARLIGVAAVLVLSACTTSTSVVRDSGPSRPVDVAHIPDAVPRHEVRTKAGNKSPYTVLGKTYRVMPDSRGFVEQGIASWYGNKFHGRKTSNGEIYSMYGMTAAHKNLPIPSYVRVTNLNNGRQIVVRVNDRGPFHQGRVIDLTYAGATKLGFIKQGTAPVRVEVVEPGGDITVAKVPAALAGSEASSGLERAPAPKNSAGYELPGNTFLQAGAFSTSGAAENLRTRIDGLTTLPVNVVEPKSDSLYRVRVGPITNNLVLMDLRSLMARHDLPAPHIVYD